MFKTDAFILPPPVADITPCPAVWIINPLDPALEPVKCEIVLLVTVSIRLNFLPFFSFGTLRLVTSALLFDLVVIAI